MTRSIFRMRAAEKAHPDPISKAAWDACLVATRAISVAVRAVTRLDYGHGHTLAARLLRLTGSSPAAVYVDARSAPPAEWSYPDFARLGEIGTEMLAMHHRITETRIPRNYISSMATALIDFHDAMDPYAKLVKRERAFERLSGETSKRA